MHGKKLFMHACSNLERRIASAIVASLALIIIYQAAPACWISGLIVFVFAWIAVKEWPLFFPVTSWRYWLYGSLYLVLPCIALISLNQSNTARFLLPLMCLLTCGSDAGAYVFGKVWGKKKLWPSVSPNKTWIGLAGGYVTACALLLLYQQPLTMMHLALLIVLSVLATTLAVAGDLFESWLKRQVGLKDSGSFLPGHGGALDRIDSLLPVSIFFCIAQSWLLTIVQ